MKCCNRHNLYFEYLEGKLDLKSQKVLEDHIRVCEHCRQFVEKLRETFSFISEEKSVSPDPFMFTNIQGKLTDSEKRPLIFSLKIAFQTAAAVVLILLGVYAGKRIGQGYSDKKTLSSDYQTEVYYLYDVQNQLVNSELLSIKSE